MTGANRNTVQAVHVKCPAAITLLRAKVGVIGL
jgi:hypothetical protein